MAFQDIDFSNLFPLPSPLTPTMSDRSLDEDVIKNNPISLRFRQLLLSCLEEGGLEDLPDSSPGYESILNALLSVLTLERAAALLMGPEGKSVRKELQEFMPLRSSDTQSTIRLLRLFASDPSDIAIWHEVLALLDRPVSPLEQEEDKRIISGLQEDWEGDYVGESHDILRKLLYAEEENFDVHNRYAKVIPIVQSSGTGKSRLVSEVSKKLAALSFVLRRDLYTGYPFGDPDITNFLITDKSNEGMHARCIALLGTAFSHQHCSFKNACEEYPWVTVAQLAEDFHRVMTPAKGTSKRSDFRDRFMKDLLRDAKEVSDRIIRDPTWKTSCDVSTNIAKILLVKQHFIQPAKDLVNFINELHKGPKKEMVLLVFDEVSTLFKDSGAHFFVLRRCIAILKDLPIWSLFLSTLSSSKFMPPYSEVEQSDRVLEKKETLLEPFLALPLDIVALKALETGYDAELGRPMSEFATAKHMSMFGRPLWHAYPDVDDLLHCVRKKILCADEFNVSNNNQVFAALASRLCLEVSMDHKEAFEFSREAVNSHLRIALSIHPLYVSTTTPSEPVVSAVVASMLCSEDSVKRTMNWRGSIKTLSSQLFSRCLVDKGHRGELFARLLCVLARDLHLTRHKRKESDFPYAEPFTVQEFLRSLLNRQIFEKVMQYTPDKPTVRTRSFKETGLLSSIFDGGHLNFSYFATTDTPLDCATMSDLLHNLIRQQAALQLCFNQKAWDLLIPVYFGDMNKTFDPSRLSAITVQVKYRVKTTPLSSNVNRKFYSQYFSHTKDPVLHILMDLGETDSGWDATYCSTRGQDIFGIHVAGASEDTFACLDAVGDAVHQFRSSVVPKSSGIREEHNEACVSNIRFRNHDWVGRFPIIQAKDPYTPVSGT